MKFKKLKPFLAAGLITIMSQATASAYSTMWFDRDAGIDRFQKVVVYPIADGNRNNFFYTEMQPYAEYNYQLHKRLTRYAKGIKYYELFDMLSEKQEMTESVPSEIRDQLLKPFATEEDRAMSIQDSFMADAYIVPFFRDRKIIVDHSPATTVNVNMYAYTDVTNAPNRDYSGTISYRTNESRWVKSVYIPAVDLNRYVSELEFSMFNDEGKKIFTCLNKRHSYTNDFDDEYKDMKDDFADDLGDIKNNKEVLKEQEKKQGNVKIYLDNLSLPNNVNNDEHKLKSCWYLFKSHALKMKNARIVNKDSILPAQYYIDGNISYYDFTPQWIEPQAIVEQEVTKREQREWKDKYGNKHIMTVTRYEPSVTTYHGYYDFSYAARVNATLNMHDARTGQIVLSQSYQEYDDKEVDCVSHIMEDFFKKADKYIKK